METSNSERRDAVQFLHSASTAPNDPLSPRADRLDCWFNTPMTPRFWAILVAEIVAVSIALVVAGLPWVVAVLTTAIACLLGVFAARDAWLRPERYTSRGLVKSAGRGFALACLGSIVAYVVADFVQHDDFDPARLFASLVSGTRKVAPVMAIVVVIVIVMMGIVAWVKRVRMQRELAWLRIVQERDAAARQLAEARLQLLQNQIQPHFIFNTLAAVQHWVDSADPRAGPLLRALTSFLRDSTELLTQERTTFGVEAEVVRHYLAIMEARLGDRLRHVVTIARDAESQVLPPGVLLTFVENAIEHGISPALHGGTVDITAEDDGVSWTLRVRDDGVGLADGWKEGIGLRNCRERLQHLFGASASLSLQGLEGATVATIRIARVAS